MGRQTGTQTDPPVIHKCSFVTETGLYLCAVHPNTKAHLWHQFPCQRSTIRGMIIKINFYCPMNMGTLTERNRKFSITVRDTINLIIFITRLQQQLRSYATLWVDRRIVCLTKHRCNSNGRFECTFGCRPSEVEGAY